MNKTFALLVSLVLAASLMAMPAQAKKKPKKVEKVERTVDVRYENPSVGSAQTGGLGLNIPSLPSASNEVFVSITVKDDVNPMAGVRVRWDLDGDGTSDGAFFVCGSTPEPVAIPGGVTLDVFPYIGGDATCPGSSAIAGTVSATFSNLP